MTALEKYIEDHPGMDENILPIGCPSTYGYLCDPAWCDFETRDCYKCWNREIPGTENKEKENDDMSPAAEYVKELEAKIKELETAIKERDNTIKMAMNMHDTDRKLIDKYRDDIAKLTFGLRIVEALTDHDILEEF